MKNCLSLFLALLFVFSLASCSDGSSVDVITTQTEISENRFAFLEDRKEGKEEEEETVSEGTEDPSEEKAKDTAMTDNSIAVTVYITETGTKYHNESCHHLEDSKIEISLEDAKVQGYTPCSVCHKY